MVFSKFMYRCLAVAPLFFNAQTLQAEALCKALTAQSPLYVVPVVELYTSEGCSYCPPADRWLSQVSPHSDIVALAFHVDYWDRLGWTDPFASATFTQRQAQQQASSGARFSYTPQVLLNGADRPDWQKITLPFKSTRSISPVDVRLVRQGSRITATLTARAVAPSQLKAYWAVTQQNLVSKVRAGENSGATLNHNFVVRQYQPVEPWLNPAQGELTTLHFDESSAHDSEHPSWVNFVVIDAKTGRPVQAAKLGC
jgi:hypothetical protein